MLDQALRVSRFITRRYKSFKVWVDAYKKNKNVIVTLKAADKPTIGAMIETTGQELKRRLDAAAAVTPTFTVQLSEHLALHLNRAKLGLPRHMQAARRAGTSAPKPQGGGVERSCIDYI